MSRKNTGDSDWVKTKKDTQLRILTIIKSLKTEIQKNKKYLLNKTNNHEKETYKKQRM